MVANIESNSLLRVEDSVESSWRALGPIDDRGNLRGSTTSARGSWRTTQSSILRDNGVYMSTFYYVIKTVGLAMCPFSVTGAARSGSRARPTSDSALGGGLRQSDHQSSCRRWCRGQDGGPHSRGSLGPPGGSAPRRERTGESYRWPKGRDRYDPIECSWARRVPKGLSSSDWARPSARTGGAAIESTWSSS